MKNFIIILLFSVFVVGCQSTLDREAAAQNDKNVQQISEDNEKAHARLVELGEMTETTKTIRDERNHKARRLARAIARDVDENYPLPAIPSNMEEEPVE